MNENEDFATLAGMLAKIAYYVYATEGIDEELSKMLLGL